MWSNQNAFPNVDTFNVGQATGLEIDYFDFIQFAEV